MAAAMAIAAGGAMPVFLTGAVGVQIKSAFAIGDAQLGLAAGIFFSLATLLTAPGGRLADRIGWRSAGWLTSGFTAFSLLGVAVFATNYAALLVLLAVGGLGFALTNPTSNLMLAVEMPAARLGLLFGIKQSAIPVATLLAGLSVPLVALTIGWRWAFAFAAVIPIAAMVAVPARTHGRTAAPRAPSGPARRVLDAPLLVLAVGGGLGSVAVGALNAFLVVGSVSAGLTEAAAGTLVSVSSVAGLASRLLSSLFADRSRSGGLRPVAALLAAGAAGFLLLSAQSPTAVVVGAVLAYGAGWGWNGLFHFAVVRHYPAAPGTASGLAQTGLSAGVAAGPVVFGVLAEAAGYRWAWAAAAAAMALAAAFVGTGAVMVGRRSAPMDSHERRLYTE